MNNKLKEKPDYKICRPCFPAIKNLWDNLKEQNGAFQTNQIAIEFLQGNIEFFEIDPNLFINNLAKKYKISSGSSTWEENKKKISRSYLVQTYNIVENFLKELIRDIKRYKKIDEKDWKTHQLKGSVSKSIDLFNQLMLNLEISVQDEVLSKPEYNLIDYYRLVRNYIVHNQSGSNIEKLVKKYDEEIRPNIKYFEGYYKYISDKIPAPNHPDEITFRDFILYSRSIRYFSYHLSNVWNLQGRDIYRLHCKTDKIFLQNLPRVYHQTSIPIEKKEKRLKMMINSYLKREFKYSHEKDVEEIYQCFIKYRD